MIYSNNWNPPLPLQKSLTDPSSNSSKKIISSNNQSSKIGGFDLDDLLNKIVYDKEGPIPFPKHLAEELQNILKNAVISQQSKNLFKTSEASKPIVFINDLDNDSPF